MHLLRRILGELKRDRRGVTAIEYALIASLISIAILGSVSLLGGSLQLSFQDTADKIAAAGG